MRRSAYLLATQMIHAILGYITARLPTPYNTVIAFFFLAYELMDSIIKLTVWEKMAEWGRAKAEDAIAIKYELARDLGVYLLALLLALLVEQ